jgi:hypothetical protein
MGLRIDALIVRIKKKNYFLPIFIPQGEGSGGY